MQIPSLEQIRAEQSRRSLLKFVHQTHPGYKANWFHRVLCLELEQFVEDVAAGKHPKLMINMPPRHGKSAIASERFPVWALGKHPDWQILACSYAAAMAEKFSRKARSIVREPLTRMAFPDLMLNPEKQGVQEWETTAGGVYKAIGVCGPATGSGAHILAIDDPIKGHEQAYSKVYRENVYDWYRSEAETRLMPESGVLLILTRWNEDDLAGRLLKEEPGEWKVISFPAIAESDEEYRKEGEALDPERYPLKILEKIKERSTWVWSALYQQRPTPEEGGIFKRSWWQKYKVRPGVEYFEKIIQSWDTTFKNLITSDYVCGQIWGLSNGKGHIPKGKAVLLDQIRSKMNAPDTVRAIKAMKEKWPQGNAIYIEEKASGSSVIATLKEEGISGIIPVQVPDGKEARASAASIFVEAGDVYIPDPNIFGPWVQEYIDEFSSFPNAEYDDQVDATSQALDKLLAVKSGGKITTSRKSVVD